MPQMLLHRDPSWLESKVTPLFRVVARQRHGRSRWRRRLASGVLDNVADVNLSLTEEQAAELAELVRSALGDLSSEIADTDNAVYRAHLNERRERLRQVMTALES